MNSTEKQNQDFLDLYENCLKDVIVLKENPSLEIIRSYFSDTEEQEMTFEYNGKKIKAKRKFTYRGTRSSGKLYEIKTNYLHIAIERNGYYENYREQKDGNFKSN